MELNQIPLSPISLKNRIINFLIKYWIFLIIIIIILVLIIIGLVSRILKNDQKDFGVVPETNKTEIIDDKSRDIDFKNDENNILSGTSSDNFSWTGGSSTILPEYKEHYAYTSENKNNKDKPVDLYYDGKLIDSAWNITSIRMWGDHLAYQRTDNYPHYDLVFDGKNLGEASYPAIWDKNIAYIKDGEKGDRGVYYNGEVLVSNCKNVDYVLWGNNIAYSCDDPEGKKVYFNKKFIGIGSIAGLHKNLLIVNKDSDKDSDICYLLYKNGEKIDSFIPKNDGFCPANAAAVGEPIGVFGDNYWITKYTGKNDDNNPIYDIDYNGKVVFTTSYPKTVLFGNTFIYGNYREVYSDGKKINSNSDILAGDSLFENNYFSTLGMNSQAFYNGKKLEKISQNGELYTRMFGNNYLVWSSGNIYKNGDLLDAAEFNTAMILGDNISYVKEVKNDAGGSSGQLILNGDVMADRFNYVSYKVITGKNIYYEKEVNGDYLYYRNKEVIGSRYGVANSKKITNLYTWPTITPETQIGTRYSNSNDAFHTNYLTSQSYENKYTFTDQWLYLTNQWK